MLAVFVDGQEIVCQGLDGHEQVVDDKLDVAIVFPPQHGDEGYAVETAQRVVRGKDETAFLGYVLFSVETHGDVEIFEQGLGEVDAAHMGVGLQEAVDAVFLNGALDVVEDKTRNLSRDSRRFLSHNLFYVNV